MATIPYYRCQSDSVVRQNRVLTSLFRRDAAFIADVLVAIRGLMLAIASVASQDIQTAFGKEGLPFQVAEHAVQFAKGMLAITADLYAALLSRKQKMAKCLLAIGHFGNWLRGQDLNL